MNSFILKGDIAYSVNKKEIATLNEGYLVCKDGKCTGVYKNFNELSKTQQKYELIDYSGKLILPGMIDLHIHAPQFNFRGTGMDLDLMPWLINYTFPEEAKFADIEYARKSYTLFVEQLKKSATTRAVVWATIHNQATELLMDLFEESGLVTYVGKVNQDRECYEALNEKAKAANNTLKWLKKTIGKYQNTYPIITPRLGVCVSEKLLAKLHEMVVEYKLPIQSHLSENRGEIEQVKKLCPNARFYGDHYARAGLFGSESKTIMAHCVFSSEDEIKLIKKNGVYVAHCPSSNMNLSSGLAPIRKYLDLGIKVGLGTDISGGESESIFRQIVSMIQVSKMYWCYLDEKAKPISFEEAFYCATLGNGDFFGKVGTFKKGYEMDAIVIDDQSQPLAYEMDIKKRLERAIYLNMDLTALKAKYVRGNKII